MSPQTRICVRLVEVGPRDGLQNEARLLDVPTRVALIERLIECGSRHIETGAFVSPRRVPQMAQSDEVLTRLTRPSGVRHAALVPNEQGMHAALAAGVEEVAVFTAASEAFSQKNIHCSIDESLRRFEPVVALARQSGIAVRGYISCVLGCPWEGEIDPAKVQRVAQALDQLGCEEISLGDTLGTGTPKKVRSLLDTVSRTIPPARLAGHFHDTYGMAIVNVHTAFEMGLRIFDTAIAGLGGCPYAPGATGNVATEDVVWLMQGLGVETGLDLEKLVDTAEWISSQLGHPPASRVSRALLTRRAAAPSCNGIRKD